MEKDEDEKPSRAFYRIRYFVISLISIFLILIFTLYLSPF